MTELSPFSPTTVSNGQIHHSWITPNGQRLGTTGEVIKSGSLSGLNECDSELV